MAVILEVKDLCKTFIVEKRQNNVLKNVCLKVEKGEMIAIMGPSGSGKTTLLYSISGMDLPTSGKVIFEGNDITKLSQNELAEIRLNKMGFIFQQMYMMKNLTLLDNIVLPSLESRQNMKSKAEKIKRAEELMRKLSVIDVADNGINEVSGGQLQRACICRGMVNNPKILFADEPTGALNRTASMEVMDEFVKLNHEGTTIILVTHDAKVAVRCKKVLYIVDGIIKGEIMIPSDENISQKEKERKLNMWLIELGW